MMGTLLSRKKKINLELYLNDVYEKECEFKIEREEVEFIQTGIETLVQNLVDKILANDEYAVEISNTIHSFCLRTTLPNKNNLVEVYFPIQSDCSLFRYVSENKSYVKTVKSTIIKAGSFYDGTKNNFPDEFDFILPLLCIRTDSVLFMSIYKLQDSVSKAISVHGKSLQYNCLSEKHQVTRNLNFKEFIGKQGPACKMQFIYSNGFGEQRPIHIDLVPAYKVIDSGTQRWFSKNVRRYVGPETFREEILSAGSCLYVHDQFAYTETEQHFMKNILSKKHVKVTRILKHLLNGNGDGENLEKYCEMSSRQTYYTSYCIKTLMIYHHEACKYTDAEDLGPCVLQVLKEMSKYKYKDEFPI